MVIYLYERSMCRYIRLNTLKVLQIHGPRFNAPRQWAPHSESNYLSLLISDAYVEALGELHPTLLPSRLLCLQKLVNSIIYLYNCVWSGFAKKCSIENLFTLTSLKTSLDGWALKHKVGNVFIMNGLVLLTDIKNLSSFRQSYSQDNNSDKFYF